MMILHPRQHHGARLAVQFKLYRYPNQINFDQFSAQLLFVSCNLGRRSPLGNLCWVACATTGIGAPDH
ncbi:MAG: hypothetical protein REJ23_12590 [Brevundimonas sp.]|nr:hypothetical protein [Brevundimonas sp.]